MAKACIFCEETGKLSAEHVFPDWSQPFLTSPLGKGTQTRVILRPDGTKDETPPRRTHPATVTVKTVCAHCNNGWMSHLEDTAKPYLLSMIRGHRRTYYEAGQKILAMWAVKTALVSGSKHKPLTPQSFYSDLYAARQPPERTRVWLIATPRPYFTYVDYRPLKVSKVDEPPVTTENAYAALLAIAHAAFYVASWNENEPDLDGLKAFEESIVPLWPTESKSVGFPPSGPALDTDDLDALADAPFGKADRSRSAL